MESLPASSGKESHPFGFHRRASDSSSSSSSSLSRRPDPTNQQEEEEQEQEEEHQQQQERTPASLRASPRDAGDKTHFILQATEDELDRQEEEGEQGHGSSSSSMSSLSSSSSLNSLTAPPDEEGEEEDQDEKEKEELAALQEATKRDLESDLDRHLAEIQEEKEERRQYLLQIKELEGGDTDMLSSLLRGIKYIYTLFFDLICMLTEDISMSASPLSSPSSSPSSAYSSAGPGGKSAH